jgi:carbon monoxide dehydrogenase subunit G
MELTSEKVLITASKEAVKNFLSNAENIKHLLPQDKVSDFVANETECSFKVQGGFVISLMQDGSSENEWYLKSGSKTPFPFKLAIKMSEVDGGTEGYMHFDGEVNMFLKMMVEKPLLQLFNYMSHKMKVYFQQ